MGTERPTAVAPLDRRRLLAYTLVLYAGFAHNVFCIPDGVLATREGFRAGHVGYDSDLVVNRLKRTRDGVPAAEPLYQWTEAEGGRPYRSQFGLQGVTLAAVYRLTGGDEQAFADGAAAVAALVTAAAAALFLADVGRRAGAAAGDVGAGLTALTPVLLPFATSLYWWPVLLAGPFAVAWAGDPWAAGSWRRFAVVLAGVTATAAVKALCGYEYLTTVALAPAAAAAYHVAARGGRVWEWLERSAALTAAALTGVAAAFVVHHVQIAELYGEDGFALVRSRAGAMTTAGTIDPSSFFGVVVAPEPTFLPASVREPTRHVLNYFWLPAVASPVPWAAGRFAVPLGAVTAAAFLAAAVVWRKRRTLPPGVAALAPAVVVAFPASLSWYLAAVTHTCIHAHLNLITYVVPFLLLAYPLFGWAVGRALRRFGLRSGPTLLTAAVAVVAVNGAVLAVRSARHAGQVADAEGRVATALRGGSVASAAGNLTAYRLGFVPRHLGSDLWENCRLVRDLGGSDRPGRVVAGWAVNPPTRWDGPTSVIVAVRDDRVIGTDVAYARMTVVERVVDHKVACTNFRVLVPDDGSHSAPIRLFAVSASGVCELTGPVLR